MKRPLRSNQGEACWIRRFRNKRLNPFFSIGQRLKTQRRRGPETPRTAAGNWSTVVEEYRLPLSPEQLCCHNICRCYLKEQKSLWRGVGVGWGGGVGALGIEDQ